MLVCTASRLCSSPTCHDSTKPRAPAVCWACRCVCQPLIIVATVLEPWFACACRILRVLRVFRMKHIMRRHLEGAVMEATAKLVFSLLSVLFISAGLFYELEKHAV